MKPEDICPDYREWPRRWMFEDEDIPVGEKLIETMTPFICSLISSGLSKKTVKRHMDNLWLLGGEIVRDVSQNEEYATFSPRDKLLDSIGPEGGPYCRDLDSESDINSFDSTCRKLFSFLRSNIG